MKQPEKDFFSSRSWRWPPLYIPNELEEDIVLSKEEPVEEVIDINQKENEK